MDEDDTATPPPDGSGGGKPAPNLSWLEKIRKYNRILALKEEEKRLKLLIRPNNNPHPNPAQAQILEKQLIVVEDEIDELEDQSYYGFGWEQHEGDMF